ncbi:MAG: hypothetical protein QOI71_3423 [Gaiellales bacterium]|nr:hypothetical protein [Gaiellales bacterium]
MWRPRVEPVRAADRGPARALAGSQIIALSSDSQSERVSAVNRYEVCVNEQASDGDASYATLEQAKAAGRVAIEPTAEDEEAPGSFIDLDSFFAVHRVASDSGRDDDAIYDSRWPT